MSAVLRDLPCFQRTFTLDELVDDVGRAVSLSARRPGSDVSEAVRQVLAEHADVTLPLSHAQWAGSPERYTRHLLHADPAGRFSVIALIWHPGHRTPVHGHRTWCAYLVLRGILREARFAWHAAQDCAVHTDTVTRHAGQTLAAPAGLADIHSLGNDSNEIAVSIHVYGVQGDQISTHVNHLVRGEMAG
ncbi:cysteine dioxygenase [Pigmentiphaga aceris]|uniref:Cysteine dioxygenase n=1 Tax=Pigmentiphaga aceris TaxID=1940612 RepID=A0A5C0B437_9BURK|nr:cysteine dioxygenase family protein [Pigmentiphaga aceris]QEI09015.1 cysteine dioxygenase [Pigmentiphaga aceris]